MPRASSTVPAGVMPAAPPPSGSSFSRENPTSAGPEKALPPTSNLCERPHLPPPALHRVLGHPPAPESTLPRRSASPGSSAPKVSPSRPPRCAPQPRPLPAPLSPVSRAPHVPRHEDGAPRRQLPPRAPRDSGARPAGHCLARRPALGGRLRAPSSAPRPSPGPAGAAPHHHPGAFAGAVPAPPPAGPAGGVRGAQPGEAQTAGTRRRPNSGRRG